MTEHATDKHSHIVILGGGFGGLYAARHLRKAKARVTIVDRRNHHVFQPLLYQVATAGLSPADIAAPIRQFCRLGIAGKSYLVSPENKQRIELAFGVVEALGKKARFRPARV